MTRARLLAPILTVLALATPAAAKVRFFSEGDLGGRFFLGSGGQNAALGPNFGVSAGAQFTSWLHLGVAVGTSLHEATVPPPPDQEFFQLYTGAAQVRLGFRVGRVGIFVQQQSGVGIISTNILDDVGITQPDRHWSPFLGAGGGLIIHTGNPRFSFGLGGDWAMYPTFDSLQTVNVRLFVRYVR
jgi:hypothetical protein